MILILQTISSVGHRADFIPAAPVGCPTLIKLILALMGINPAPTQQIKQRLVGAGFTPARSGCKVLEIARIR